MDVIIRTPWKHGSNFEFGRCKAVLPFGQVEETRTVAEVMRLLEMSLAIVQATSDLYNSKIIFAAGGWVCRAFEKSFNSFIGKGFNLQ